MKFRVLVTELLLAQPVEPIAYKPAPDCPQNNGDYCGNSKSWREQTDAVDKTCDARYNAQIGCGFAEDSLQHDQADD